MNWIYIDVMVGLTHLVNDGYFMLLAHLFVHHVHFWRTHHCLSKWNDGLGCTDLNFCKPLKRQVKIL